MSRHAQQHEDKMNEELLFEYEELRKEILQNDNISLQILNFVLIVTGGIAGFVFSQTFDNHLKAVLFFLVSLICLVGMSQKLTGYVVHLSLVLT